MYFLSKILNVRGKNEKYSGKVKNEKNTAMLDDVTGPQQRHLHMYTIILTSSCRQHNALSIKVKNFSKYCKVTKTPGGGVPTTAPPPSTCTTVGQDGMSLHVLLLPPLPLEGIFLCSIVLIVSAFISGGSLSTSLTSQP